ncbi:hypothetical protein SEA_SHARKBOY_64 [Microbacterium phage Sharkboy]|uniref:Uncharacterized protein n=2 Tax=Dismasvirus dismas TaxID=2560588 RepID=A0A516KUE1_9CAUD|nr:hypothetical protein PBI_KIERAN_61 [Microbacterium phage Kieran]QDP45300.1 hypothetical protein SEA_SHARKBOY_64 [Microbacterium phage Sharkboy]WNM67382.1 hypothetical protein SEA_CHILIPEPPER_61 [Microbacterium phage ChiliPepper]
METRYVVRDPSGELVAGDAIFDDQLKFVAASVSGQVLDAWTGEVVYDASPGSGLDSTIL